MPAVDLNAPLFYRFLGFDREGFINATNLARQRFRRVQDKPETAIEAPRKEVNARQQPAQIPLVSAALSVPRSLHSPPASVGQQLILPLPNYQQFIPSLVQHAQNPIDLYA